MISVGHLAAMIGIGILVGIAARGIVPGYSPGSVLVGADTVQIVADVADLLVARTVLGVASCAITLGATKWPT